MVYNLFMKINELIGININELQLELGILNTDFNSDLPYFLDINKMRDLQRKGRHFADVNLTNIFVEKVGNLSEDGERLLNISEPKGWGLGFSDNSNDGYGPRKEVVKIIRNHINAMDAQMEHAINNGTTLSNDELVNSVEYFTTILEGMGPDGLSDLMLIVYLDELYNCSNELALKLIHQYPRSQNFIEKDENNNYYIKNGEVKRYFVPFESVSHLQEIADTITRANATKYRIKKKRDIGQTVNDTKSQLSDILARGLLDRQSIKVAKMLKFATDSSVKGAFKIVDAAIKIHDAHRTDTVDQILINASKFVSGTAPIKNGIHQNDEKIMQSLLACYFAGAELNFHRETMISRGIIDFIITKDAEQHYIEVKALAANLGNLMSSIVQAEQYVDSSNQVRGVIKRGTLIYFSDNNSIELVDDLIKDGLLNIRSDFKLIVVRGGESHSKMKGERREYIKVFEGSKLN